MFPKPFFWTALCGAIRRVPLAVSFLVGGLTLQFANGQVVRIAPKASACDANLVDAGLEVSGLKDAGKLIAAEVGPMFAQMQQTMRAQGKRLPPADRDRILAIMQQAFDADAVGQEVQRSMRSHCEPKLFAAAVEQLRTPLATKIRGLENEFNRLQSQAAINRYALIEALEKTVHQADFAADTDAQVILALYMGLSEKSTDDAQFGAIRDKLLPAVQQATRVQLLMVYRNAADEELDQYIMLLRTPEIQRFQTIHKSAFQNAMVRRSQVPAAMIKQHLDENRANRR
jgi:hypothetical protein